MNLRNSKRWLLCLLSAFLLCLGLHLWCWTSAPGSGSIVETSMMTTYPTDWTQAVAGTTVTQWVEETDDTEGTVQVWEEETPPARKSALRYGALGAMVLGSLLALWFFRQKGSCSPYLCPETEVLLGAALGALTVFVLWNWSATWLIGAGTLTAAGALWAVRSLLRRLVQGLHLRDTGASRLGRRTGSALGYGVVQLALTVLFFTGGVFLCLLRHWTGAPLLLYAGVPAACLVCLCRDMDRLTREIQRLHEGEPVAQGEGFFAGDLETLGDLQHQRDEAVKTALSSERFKVELISNVSHDLRTPLTAILGYGELLEQETLSPRGRERLTLLNRKAGYMRDLVEALFELTKVSSGVVEAERRELDLIRLLEQTLGLLDDRLREAGLEVRRYYPEGALPIRTDGGRMHQVFTNLLENAIKYALPGTRIYLEVRKGEGTATVRLTNTASYDMDFNPEDIVQRFARGDKARSTQGSGIGLAIAQTYTESCGGKFRVKVDGDQFRALVTLPCEETPTFLSF